MVVGRELLGTSASLLVWWAAGGRCAKLESELKELSFPAIQSLRFDAEKKTGVATTLYSILILYTPNFMILLVYEATQLLIELLH